MMPMPRTRISLITGSLGSGKTTLLRRMIAAAPARMAVLVNEFGEIGIDGELIRAADINMIELAGGCVCCELTGEFEAAVNELIDTVRPELIVVEATGVAESDAIVLEVEQNLPDVRLDSVICVVDAYTSLKYPQVGYVGRQQLETADLFLLNKVDLVQPPELEEVESRIRRYNEQAPILRSSFCEVDIHQIWGAGLEKNKKPARTLLHLPEFDQFAYQSDQEYDRLRLEGFLEDLPESVFRVKGFILLEGESYLLNYTAGRCDLEPHPAAPTRIVFIGPKIESLRESIVHGLEACRK